MTTWCPDCGLWHGDTNDCVLRCVMSRRLDDTDLQDLLDAAYGGHVYAVDVVRLVEEVKWYRDCRAVITIPTGCLVSKIEFTPVTFIGEDPQPTIIEGK